MIATKVLWHGIKYRESPWCSLWNHLTLIFCQILSRCHLCSRATVGGCLSLQSWSHRTHGPQGCWGCILALSNVTWVPAFLLTTAMDKEKGNVHFCSQKMQVSGNYSWQVYQVYNGQKGRIWPNKFTYVDMPIRIYVPTLNMQSRYL